MYMYYRHCVLYSYTVNLEIIFIVKIFLQSIAAMKINLTKTYAHYINVNAVRGSSYETFSTQKFVIRKFHNTKISRSTVHVMLSKYQKFRQSIDDFIYWETRTFLLSGRSLICHELQHLMMPLQARFSLFWL